MDAAPLEGQVFGNNVHLLGGEVHSYLFAGTITCGEERGTFLMSKDLENITPDDLPDGTTFPLDWQATLPDGSIQAGTIQVPADGTPQGPIALDRTWATFPVGTVVVFTEPQPGSVPGSDWTGATVSESPITITSSDPVIDITLTNTAERQTGTFEVAKTVTDGTGTAPSLPADATVSVSWSASAPDGAPIDTGVLDLEREPDGSYTPTGPVDDDGQPVQFPVGTEIVLDEPNLPEAPANYTWGDPSWSPASVLTIDHADQQVTIELVNVLLPVAGASAFTAVKLLDAEGTDVPTFTLEYTLDPAGATPRTTGEADFSPDSPVRIDTTPDGDPIPDGATVWVREAALPPGGQVWDEPVLSANGQPLDGPDEDGFYELPLVDNETIQLDVANVGRLPHGSFTLEKALDGLDLAAVPEDLQFTVNWTATYPDGSTLAGSSRLAAGGGPVPPTGADGEPLTFPQGTTVTFEETQLPQLPGWTWGEPTVDPETLTVAGDVTTAVTVTNTAEVIEGSFAVSKALSGIEAGQVLTDSFAVDWSATLPDGSTAEGSLQVPADGTAAGPDGQFPVGTMIALTEPDLPQDALPPLYEWVDARWSPGASLVVAEDTGTEQFTLTNTAVPGTSITVDKIVDGDATVPADLQFPIEYSVLGEDEVTQAQISPGDPLVIDRVTVGTVIELRELPPEPVPGVDWAQPVWTLGGEVLEPDEDGWLALQADSTDPLQLTVTNTASAVPEASFTVAKSFDGVTVADLPPNTTFPVSWEAQLPDGTSSTGTIDVPADGEPVGPSDADGSAVAFPFGTQITYGETLPDLDGIVWDAATFAPETVTIGAGGTDVAVSLTNSGHTSTDVPGSPDESGAPGSPDEPGAPGGPDEPGNPGTPPVTDGPQLPGTGFGSTGLLIIATALVLLGLGVGRLRFR